MDRNLALFDSSDTLVPYAAELLWGVMHYPDSFSSALQFQLCASVQRDQMKTGNNAVTHGIRLFLADFERRAGRANIAGFLAGTLIRLKKNGHAASIRRAAHFVSEEALEFQEPGRKTRSSFPTDQGAIMKAFREYGSVAHFWAASQVTRTTIDVLTESDQQIKHFLHVANLMMKLLESAAPGYNLERWVPNKVPADVEIGLVHFWEFTKEETEILNTYSVDGVD